MNAPATSLYELDPERLPATQLRPRKVVDFRLDGELPPHHLDSEATVLATVLFDEDGGTAAEMFDVIAGLVDPTDFYLPAHEAIAGAIWALRARGAAASVVNVSAELKTNEKLQLAGGSPYLAKLAQAIPASGSALLGCAKTIADLARERRILRTAAQILSEGYHAHGESSEWAGSCEARIAAATQSKGEAGVPTWHEAVTGAYNGVVAAAENPQGAFGPRFGLARLDRVLGGAGATQVTVIAANPGEGKSSLAMQAGEYIAMQYAESPPKENRPRTRCGVLVFGLEMSKEELGLRRTCARAGVDYQMVKARRGRLEQKEWDKLNATAPTLARLPIWVEDFQPRNGQPGAIATFALIRSKLRRTMTQAKRKNVKIVAVVFDYLQLGDAAGLVTKNASREECVSAMSRAFKALARQFGVHVILVSQFNRGVTKEKRRPKMSDLRESGAIEQDANNILLIYHLSADEAHDKMAEYAKKGIPTDDYEFALANGYSLAEIIVEKQRGGAAHISIDVAWEAKFTSFVDLEHLRAYHNDGILYEPLEDAV